MDPIPAQKLTFLHSDLAHLSDDEKCIFFQAGIVLTELRFFDLQLHSHVAWIRKKKKNHDAELGILLSQITLLLAHLAGKLVEANNVIKTSYYSASISKKYAPLLSTDATEALGRIKAYFANKNNLASVLRNNFGFHYDREKILLYVSNLDPNFKHHAYLPEVINDAVLEFGQTTAMNALFEATGASNAVEGFFNAYGELGVTVTRDFVVFFHGVLEAIGKSVSIQSEKTRITRHAGSPALYLPGRPGLPGRR